MKLLRIALPAWVLLFAFAFVAAPKSCEWGLSAYTLAGVIAIVGSAVLPLAERGETATVRRSLHALGLVTATLLVWLGGLFAANVRIMCRLF